MTSGSAAFSGLLMVLPHKSFKTTKIRLKLSFFVVVVVVGEEHNFFFSDLYHRDVDSTVSDNWAGNCTSCVTLLKMKLQ